MVIITTSSFEWMTEKTPKKFQPDIDKLNTDIAYYINKGFSHISTFACYLGDDYEALYGEVDISHFTNAVKNYN